MVKQYRLEAIVLKRHNFGEADRLVTVFSQQQGKTTLVAKGIRRLTSRKKGDLEPFARVKLNCTVGHKLDLVTDTAIVDYYSPLRQSLSKVANAYVLIELVDRLLPDHDEQPAVYQLLVDTLSLLNLTVSSHDSLVFDFTYRLLEILGYWSAQKGHPAGFDILNYARDMAESDIKSRTFLNSVTKL